MKKIKENTKNLKQITDIFKIWANLDIFDYCNIGVCKLLYKPKLALTLNEC